MFAVHKPSVRPAAGVASRARAVIRRAGVDEKARDAASSAADKVSDAAGQAQEALEATPAKPADPDSMGGTPASTATDMSVKLNIDAPAEPQSFSLWTRTQELINGRAAMVGFLFAVGSEIVTHQSVLSQITGKVRSIAANGTPVQLAASNCNAVRVCTCIAQPVNSVDGCPSARLLAARSARAHVSCAGQDSLHLSVRPIFPQVIDGDVVETAKGASWFGWGAVVVILTMASLAPRIFANAQPEDREYGIWRAAAETLNGRIAMLGFLSLLATEAVTHSSPLF